MKKTCIRFLIMAFHFIISVAISIVIIGCNSSTKHKQHMRPIVFVHGYAGSADQFASQALRFVSNGYTADYISGFEYDTTTVTGNPTDGFVVPEDILSALDEHIDAVLAQTKATQVDLLGHSMGTAVSQEYLSYPERAAKVAHYVNIDGSQSETLPGGVPTLALWAELSVLDTIGSIGGATNITLDNSTHVQAATSGDAFVEMFKFFQNNNSPETTEILAEDSSVIELSGRVVTFMTNKVPANLTLDIYATNTDTGARLRSTPDYSTPINADGKFTFTNAAAGSVYEFQLSMSTVAVHYYYEPFIRSDHLIRLKYILPTLMSAIMDQNANHSNLIIIRDKEFLGVDTLSPNEDSLKVNGIELCKGILPNPGKLGTPIALFIFDKDSDSINNISAPISSGLVSSLPFVSGLDFVMSASVVNPPSGTIPIVLEGRYSGKTQTINVPNWQSSTDIISVQMMDY